LHLVGILFPHINDDARSKSHQIRHLEVMRQETVVACITAILLPFPEVISGQLLETRFSQGGFRKRTQDLVNMKQVDIQTGRVALLFDVETPTFSVRLNRVRILFVRTVADRELFWQT